MLPLAYDGITAVSTNRENKGSKSHLLGVKFGRISNFITAATAVFFSFELKFQFSTSSRI